MLNKILEEIYRYTNDEAIIHGILVNLFVIKNNLKIKSIKNIHIKNVLDIGNNHTNIIKGLLGNLNKSNFGFEELILEFEKIVSIEDKVSNGVVYTPRHIREYIIEESFSRYQGDTTSVRGMDIACGCGNFLFSLSIYLKKETQKPFKDIYSENIFGIDISAGGIERTKILLELLAISEGEDYKDFNFNLFIGNTLSIKFLKEFSSKFDLVIGNPPYVRSKNLSEESKKLLKHWSVSNIGNSDLYIPFFQIGMSYLKKGGVLGYITVNSFFKSLNARGLRDYLSSEKYSFDIIDFGGQQIFDNKSTYTCLCFIENTNRAYIKYKKLDDLDFYNQMKNSFLNLDYSILDNKNGWILNNNFNITKIEATGKKLGDIFQIKNGIATLKNDIYVFKPTLIEDRHYIFQKNGKEYRIEKEICRNIIKPNTLKASDVLSKKMEKIIYPYRVKNGVVIDIQEAEFKKLYKGAYKYLLDHKEILFNREKGEAKLFAPWYKFGRNQALLDRGYKILLPYMSGSFKFQITDELDLLIYCGYAVYSNDLRKLKILNSILGSSIFEYYIKNTSKPYSGNFYSLAKNHIKSFGICKLNIEEEEFLLNEIDKEKINQFLLQKYDICIG